MSQCIPHGWRAWRKTARDERFAFMRCCCGVPGLCLDELAHAGWVVEAMDNFASKPISIILRKQRRGVRGRFRRNRYLNLVVQEPPDGSA